MAILSPKPAGQVGNRSRGSRLEYPEVPLVCVPGHLSPKWAQKTRRMPAKANELQFTAEGGDTLGYARFTNLRSGMPRQIRRTDQAGIGQIGLS